MKKKKKIFLDFKHSEKSGIFQQQQKYKENCDVHTVISKKKKMKLKLFNLVMVWKL